MLYYQVKKDVFLRNRVGVKRNNYALIENELFTISELNNLFTPHYLELNVDKLFTILNINKNNTYIMFGCRFENKNGGD